MADRAGVAGAALGHRAAVAGRLIVVDAIDDAAAAFYTHHDFQPVRDKPRRLIMKIATAGKELGF